MLFFYLASSVNRWLVFAGILCALSAFSSTVYRYYAIRCPARHCLLSVLPGELRCRGSRDAIGLTNR